MDLLELTRHLKQEQLFVTSQRSQIQKLYEDVKKVAEDLYHESWIVRQQRGCLEILLSASQNCTPKDCYTRINQLEWTNFIDGYKQLSYHESKYTDFLKFLRENPVLLASIIENGERSSMESLHKFVKLVSCSVYGNIVLQEDEYLMAQMVRGLAELQLAPSSDPRRLLRKGSCAFSVTCKLMFDMMYSVKLFLTAALHDPVMRLLMEDEWFYDIDPQKALHRFPPAERVKRFGDPNSENYATKCQEYRKFIINKLVVLTNRFITNIKSNIHCFPPTLAWIVSQVYQILTKSEKHDVKKVRTVCADLVFSLFMCPVIIDPEPHGITSDVHISHIARHNLIQIAQIIQTLAHMEEDSKEKDLYDRFEKGCVSSLLDIILENAGGDMASMSTNSHLAGLSRASVLITTSQLNFMVNFLRSSLPGLPDTLPEKKNLEEHLAGLVTLLQNQTNNCAFTPASTALSPTTAAKTPPGTPGEKKKTPKSKKKILSTPSSVEEQSNSGTVDSEGSTNQNTDEVLVIPLGIEADCPGMMSEQKVLSWEQENKPRRIKCPTVSNYEPVGNPVFQEKRTRFSLSQDQESIDLSLTGNTSDIQEAISEAASSHSVGSVDLENDDDNDDNFSDMISANVSGRGTPDISGRDTPLSGAGSVEEPVPPQMPIPDIPPLPETIKKSNREDVTERFGKFEIKSELERDETKSTVSDTWSTDVLASDSEPPENQYDRLEEVVRQSLLARQERVCEVSETASDAWSTDVLASDTEDKQALSEFDQDDIGSVTDLASMAGDQAHVDLNEGRQSPIDDHVDLLGASGVDSSLEVEPLVPVNVGPSWKARSSRKGVVGRGNTGSIDSVFMESEEPLLLPTRSHDKSHDPARSHDTHDSNRLSIPLKQSRPHSAGRSGSHGRHGPLLSVPEHGNTTSKLVNHSNILVPQPSDKAQSLPSIGHDDKPLPSFMPLNTIGNISSNIISDSARPNSNFKPGRKLGSNDLQELESLAFENPIFNGGARPKQRSSCPQMGANRDPDFIRKENEQKKSRSVIEWTASCSTDSGIGGTPHSMESQSLDSIIPIDRSSQQSMDSVTDQTGVLKLTEQQNTNFDTNRLSAGLTMFDPYSSDTQTDQSTEHTNLFGSVEKEHTNLFTSVEKEHTNVFTPVQKVEHTNSFSPVEKVDNWDPLQSNQGDIIQQSGNHGNREYNVGLKPARVEGLMAAQSDILVQLGDRDSVTSTNSTASGNTSDGVPFAKSSRSASFDNVSEGKEGDMDSDERKKKGIFKSLKDRVSKGIKKKNPKLTAEEEEAGIHEAGGVETKEGNDSLKDQNETSDDILEKYRKKPESESSGTEEKDTISVPTIDIPAMKEKRLSIKDDDVEGPPLYDPNNVEGCFAFSDAKRKLRLVMSSPEFQIGYSSAIDLGGTSLHTRKDLELHTDTNVEILKLLKGQLAEAINLQNKDVIAQLHEAIRCVKMFDSNGCKKLLRSLHEDYQSRASYVSYLIRCQQGLLATHSFLQRLVNRVRRDKAVCNNHMTQVCVRLFVEKKEGNVMRFMSDFQKLTMPDEKTDLVEKFLQFLYEHMYQDPIWQASNESQLEDAQLAIERFLMSRIYTHAMFPNGDGDILRDQLFHQHIKKLSQIITPSHRDLRIPRVYQFECPWTAAQKELYMINAYKTPKDKVKCVTRCSTTIMNLLSMANERSVPAADDFLPVLIYVIIKANPPCMLSTNQYVNSFYGDRFSGEEQYWWIQFSSALEFIKTMEYSLE